MKAKLQETNKKLWLGTAISFALLILFAQPQTAGAQQWTTNGNHISNTNSGNVGIGTSNPAAKLDILSAGTARVLAGDGCYNLGVFGGIGLGISSFSGCTNYSILGDGTNSYFNAPSGFLFFRIGNVSKLTIHPSGNIGIGLENPGFSLDVQGTATNQILRLTASNPQLNWKTTAAGNQEWMWQLVDTTVDGNGRFRIFNQTAGTEPFTLTNAGNVGIGRTNPGYKLDVNGEINATGLRINGTPISTGGAVNSVFGRTGAVVAAPNDYTWAQINKTTSSLADLTTRSASDLSSGTLPDARFPATLPAASGANLTGLNASNLASGTVAPARLGSGTANSTTFLRGDNTWAVPSGGSQWTPSGLNIYYNTGNVGIGTLSPTVKLHVVGDGKVTGNLTVDGNIAAKYQDVAEWVPASEQISAGTVVVLDSTKSNQVISSTQAYDTRVAGVISEKPGIALGERGDNKVLVATTGRVRIKVDATRGPIHIGDLLVTSDISGMAMKSEPVSIGGVQIHRPGTLIGKALEPLAKGQGEILVLLSLQ